MGRASDGYQRPGHSYRQITPGSQFSILHTAGAVAATLPAPALTTSIQTRPLQGNPSHPLLWNGTATSATGPGGGQTSLSRKSRAGWTPGVANGGHAGAFSSFASLSTSRSSCASTVTSGDGRLQRRVSRDGPWAPSASPSSNTTAHVLRLRRPTQSRMPPSSSSPSAPLFSTAAETGGAVNPTKPDRERKVAAVNYNALLQHELQQQQQQQQQGADVGAWPPPPLTTGEHEQAQSPPSAREGAHDMAAWGSYGGGGTAILSPSVTASTEPAGTVEGPLPPDVRRIIAQSCTVSSSGADTNAIIDAVEQQARRLISTGRRVKVYREELTAAEEERRDLFATVEERQLVRSALQCEVDDINARIEALLQERALIEAQLHTQDDAAARDARKLAEAQERVRVLRETIDGVVGETMLARQALQQQVPSLCIENYC
ncbi:hypothetical protein GH5_07801 [Leishmania sp. Ghana 2012 LV757]|uniref:hypothetical protein n=1 Tax=Leishmania sp. Ghana 2012 LV757 TaxID=2803181 RepID=UPI001B75FDB6|nr:hypothetical protein GH5_07801 [Leishmania sp. Ghana 2012 LV757]